MTNSINRPIRLLACVALGTISVCLIAGQACAQEEVQWMQSPSKAAAKAQQLGKPILIYVRSKNCHYCDLMQKNVWKDTITSKTIMRDFVPLKLTKEENPEAVKAMKVSGFPSTLVFTSKLKYMGRFDGYVGPEEFLAGVSKAKRLLASNSASEIR